MVDQFYEMVHTELINMLPHYRNPVEKVPELFSGHVESPLWFVAGNPKGEDYRPTVSEAQASSRYYYDYYRKRFDELILPERIKRSDPVWTATNQAYFVYASAFGEGAGIPLAERWRLLFKTNAAGLHTRDKPTLTQWSKNEYIADLGQWLERIIVFCRPSLVIGFGVDADDRLGRLNPIRFGPKGPFPQTDWSGDKTVILSIRSTAAHICYPEMRSYMEELGRWWISNRSSQLPLGADLGV